MSAGKLCILLLSLIILAPPLSAAGAETEGGNISRADVSLFGASRWHGACGQVSSSPFAPAVITATGGAITSLTIQTGSSSCAHGAETVNLLFSNSSSAISSLAPGSLALLDSFVGSHSENASSTFLESSTFSTSGFGSISGVPTAYTEPAAARKFRLGFLQDQSGNLVFITPAVSDETGYNGSPMDFQAMLPTNNGSAVQYHVSVDISCSPAPPTPSPSPGPSYTVSPGASIPIYAEMPNVTIPTTAPRASDIRVLRFSPFREVLPGDNIVINPLLENPTDQPVSIRISLAGAGAALANPVANVFLPAYEKMTVPFALHIPDDMPAGYYSLVMNISTGKSEVSYPSIIRVVRSFRADQPAVKRQFSLDYENGETLVSLTMTNRGADPISHIQVYEAVPPVFFDELGNRKFTTQLTSVSGEGSSTIEGSNIRWDVEDVLPQESRTIFYRVPLLLTDLSDYAGWNLAQLIIIDKSSQADILVRDLQVPTMLPGDKGEITMKLFNSGGVAHDVELDIIGPQGWKINPRALTLNMPSRSSEDLVFEVESPAFVSAGTYGITLRMKYRNTFFDKQIFVFIYEPVVEFFAPPLPDQLFALMGGVLPNLLLLAFVLAAAAGIAFALHRKINSAKYSQERLDSLRQMEKMLDGEEEAARQARRVKTRKRKPPQ